jgi:hypothetical protein
MRGPVTGLRLQGAAGWSPRQESNLYLALRRHSFYPLNYEEGGRDSNLLRRAQLTFDYPCIIRFTRAVSREVIRR